MVVLRLLVADELEREAVPLVTVLLFVELLDDELLEDALVALHLLDVALALPTELFCAAEALEPPRED